MTPQLHCANSKLHFEINYERKVQIVKSQFYDYIEIIKNDENETNFSVFSFWDALKVWNRGFLVDSDLFGLYWTAFLSQFLTRNSWSYLRSNKIVKGPRCPKQVSVKSDLLLSYPHKIFENLCFFNVCQLQGFFWSRFRGQISFTCWKVFCIIYWRFQNCSWI